MKRLKVNYRSLFNQCITCLKTTHNSSGFCEPCRKDLPWLKTHCSICALPLPAQQDHLICGKCLKSKPSFTKVQAPFLYMFPINHFIGKIKYNKKPQYIGPLASLLINSSTIPSTIDLIIPIPMHRSNLQKRGFNQAELLAKEMSNHLGIEIDTHSLKKNKKTIPQMELDRDQRLKNQRGVFICDDLKHKHILLVDDVMTTGATMEAATRVLLKAGATSVHVIVIARTPN